MCSLVFGDRFKWTFMHISELLCAAPSLTGIFTSKSYLSQQPQIPVNLARLPFFTVLYFPASQTRKCLGHTWDSSLVFPFSRGSESFSENGASYILPIRFLCPWGFSRQEYWSGLPCPPPEDHLKPGIKLRSPALQVDSIPSELPGKPKNTGVGSLSFLQEVFLTQELNQGLLYCRHILYHLSYQESPYFVQCYSYLCPES